MTGLRLAMGFLTVIPVRPTTEIGGDGGPGPTAVPLTVSGSRLCSTTLPIQSGPTQSAALNCALAPGASASTVQMRLRRQSPNALK